MSGGQRVPQDWGTRHGEDFCRIAKEEGELGGWGQEFIQGGLGEVGGNTKTRMQGPPRGLVKNPFSGSSLLRLETTKIGSFTHLHYIKTYYAASTGLESECKDETPAPLLRSCAKRGTQVPASFQRGLWSLPAPLPILPWTLASCETLGTCF